MGILVGLFKTIRGSDSNKNSHMFARSWSFYRTALRTKIMPKWCLQHLDCNRRYSELAECRGRVSHLNQNRIELRISITDSISKPHLSQANTYSIFFWKISILFGKEMIYTLHIILALATGLWQKETIMDVHVHFKCCFTSDHQVQIDDLISSIILWFKFRNLQSQITRWSVARIRVNLGVHGNDKDLSRCRFIWAVHTKLKNKFLWWWRWLNVGNLLQMVYRSPTSYLKIFYIRMLVTHLTLLQQKFLLTVHVWLPSYHWLHTL